MTRELNLREQKEIEISVVLSLVKYFGLDDKLIFQFHLNYLMSFLFKIKYP